MKSDLKKVGLHCSWEDLTEGMQIYGEMTSKEFKTGEWATVQPVLDNTKCIHCLLCVDNCPCQAIAVQHSWGEAIHIAKRHAKKTSL